MSRKSISAIVVGLLILALTFMIFSNVFDATAPSEAEFNAVAANGVSGQALLERSQQAEGVRTLFYFIAGVEVIMTGLLAYQWRREN
jgi:hypothetical protein